MRTANLCLIAGLALALPGAAIAQANPNASSVDYCNVLAKKYTAQAYGTVGVDKAVAIANCKTDPTASIATLQQAMKDARMEMPSPDQTVTASQKK